MLPCRPKDLSWFSYLPPAKKGIWNMTFARTASFDFLPSSDLFRKKYYGIVYQHAFRVTGADLPAKKLTERVFQELERRFASDPLTGHIDAYLAGQVYLSYAQKGLADDHEGMAYESLLPEAERVRREPAVPQAALAEGYGREAEQPALSREDAARIINRAFAATAPQVTAAPPLQDTVASPPSPKEEPRASAERRRLPDPAPASVSVPRDRENYDRSSTIYWVPGMETETPAPEEPAEEPVRDYFEFEFPKQPERRQSKVFSILNALLALGCIGAVVYLLMELEIIPALF